jgi:tetratricopeptide (TPR) repeat protein
VVYLARKKPYLAVGWLWFLGTLVPVIGLVQVGSQSMADRYTYIPSIGLLVIVAWGIPDLLPDTTWRKPALTAGLLIPILACAILTVRQVDFWQNSETLFRQALQVTPGSSLVYNKLGATLTKRGKLDEGIEMLRAAIRLKANYPEAYSNLGNALAAQQKFDEAINAYTESLRLRPNDARTRNNLGNVFLEKNRLEEAISQYSEAVALSPDNPEIHFNLGLALAQSGKNDQAITQYQETLRLNPNIVEAQKQLKVLLKLQASQ